MTTTRAGEIWLVGVEFTDGSGKKPRPMLSLFSDQQDTVFAVVTSAAPRTRRDVALHQWQAAGLRKPSTVRLDKLITITSGRLWAKLGDIEQRDWDAVISAWNQQMRLS